MFRVNRRVLVRSGLAGCSALIAVIAISAVAQQPAPRRTAVQEIPEATLKSLLEKAKAASKCAYCPYSKFPVGAAVLTDGGDVFTGCNVENASYGLAICAERNAAFQMVAKGKQRILAVAIYTPTKNPSAPCGACRQVVNEFGPDAVIVCACDGPAVLRKRLCELLPDAFGPTNVKQEKAPR